MFHAPHILHPRNLIFFTSKLGQTETTGSLETITWVQQRGPPIQRTISAPVSIVYMTPRPPPVIGQKWELWVIVPKIQDASSVDNTAYIHRRPHASPYYITCTPEIPSLQSSIANPTPSSPSLPPPAFEKQAGLLSAEGASSKSWILDPD